ncbi:hypothetical protein GEMRC1_010527 [Eukaryota sp. GEM-RC1]
MFSSLTKSQQIMRNTAIQRVMNKLLPNLANRLGIEFHVTLLPCNPKRKAFREGSFLPSTGKRTVPPSTAISEVLKHLKKLSIKRNTAIAVVFEDEPSVYRFSYNGDMEVLTVHVPPKLPPPQYLLKNIPIIRSQSSTMPAPESSLGSSSCSHLTYVQLHRLTVDASPSIFF